MKKRKLGRELDVSAIGLGCMGFSHGYGGAEEKDAIAAIQELKERLETLRAEAEASAAARAQAQKKPRGAHSLAAPASRHPADGTIEVTPVDRTAGSGSFRFIWHRKLEQPAFRGH